jgi:hypothetical protein
LEELPTASINKISIQKFFQQFQMENLYRIQINVNLKIFPKESWKTNHHRDLCDTNLCQTKRKKIYYNLSIKLYRNYNNVVTSQ